MALSERRDRGDQDVARAAYRLDQLRILAVVVELAPQPADLHVDRAVERPGLATSCVLEQEVTRQDAPAMRDERMQQVELAGAQRHFSARGIDQPARGRVELPAA